MLHLFSSHRRSHAPRVKPDAAQSGPDPLQAVDSFWQQRYFHEPYFVVGRSYDQYRPAYLMGWMVDRVCDAYHKFKKEEEKDGKEK